MMLIEQTKVPARSLPIGAFKGHLRLGTGFANDGTDEALLEGLLRAAMAAVEARTGKALLMRRFNWSLTGWRESARQALPIAPVRELIELRVVDRRDGATIVAPDDYVLDRDMHRPRLGAAGRALPAIPSGGRAEIAFEAGFGPTWRDVPADLAHAVFLLAAHYHEHRYVTGLGESAIPFGVTTLLERWRTVRILGGGAA